MTWTPFLQSHQIVTVVLATADAVMWIKQLREHLQQHSPEVMCLKEAELGFHLSQIIEQTVRILPILCDLSIVVELNGSSPGIRALFFLGAELQTPVTDHRFCRGHVTAPALSGTMQRRGYEQFQSPSSNNVDPAT